MAGRWAIGRGGIPSTPSPSTSSQHFVASTASTAAPPATAAAAERPIDFGRDIQPILARRCFACHGPDKAEGGLRLNGREAALAELDSGAHAIVPGKPDESELLRRIASTDDDERMPPGDNKPLSAEQVALVRQWIAQGAEWRGHWAFEPVGRAIAPGGERSSAGRAARSMRFILGRLEREGLAPAPPAEKSVLLRRAYYDLTGLPPTPDEVAAFLADPSPEAFAKVVDRLLDSPRYGERWGRHWLDVVRYADTNSFERDSAKPNAWRYRDYVIRSLNADKPYDQFLLEQLAGDELPDAGDRRDHRHRFLSPRPLGRRAGRPRAIPLRRTGRHRQHDRPGPAGADDQLRPLPRPQDRPADAARLLPDGRVFQWHSRQCVEWAGDRNANLRRAGQPRSVRRRAARPSSGEREEIQRDIDQIEATAAGPLSRGQRLGCRRARSMRPISRIWSFASIATRSTCCPNSTRSSPRRSAS